VHEHDAAGRADLRQCGLQLERLVQRLLDEQLDRFFPPRAEGPPAEPAGEPLHTREPDPAYLVGAPVEHVHARVAQDPAQLGDLPRLVVVVSEHGDRGHGGPAEHPREPPGLLGIAGIGQVAAEREHVRPVRQSVEQRPKRRTVTGPAEMEVGHRGDPNGL
jgi:hypothetical protein